MNTGRPLWQVVLIFVLGLGLAFGFLALGIWQIERLGWKRDLIARVEARIQAEPVPWTELIGQAPRDLEYRPVRVSGHFLPKAETWVKAVTEHGGGFWVIASLQTDEGPVILINRGFIPPEGRTPEEIAARQVSGPVTITGLARISEPEGAFLRKNDPQADLWYSRDIDQIAGARGLNDYARFFIDAGTTSQSGNSPIGGLTVIRFRNTHLAYALTWFALAGMTFWALVTLIRFEQRR